MKRVVIALTLALACSSCNVRPSEQAKQAGAPEENQLVESPVAVEAIKPGEPGGLPDDRTPTSEGAIEPKSAQGAGQVLQQFGGLLEQGRFGEAYRLWSDGGRASELLRGDLESQTTGPQSNSGGLGRLSRLAARL